MVSGRSETIVVVASVFLVLPLLAVILRCYVRWRLVQGFGWDDGFMVLAMVIHIAFQTCGIAGAVVGIGQPQSYFTDQPHAFSQALLLWWLAQDFYLFASLSAKISIIISICRLTIVWTHRILLYAIGAASLIVHVVMFFFLFFQCSPVSYFWNRQRMSGTCLPTSVLLPVAYTYSVTAAVCDFAMGLLPVMLVWNLQLGRRTKCMLAIILGIGCLAGVAVVVRIPYLHRYTNTPGDFLYVTYQLSLWSNIESGLGITAGSLITLRPLLRHLRDYVFQLRSRNSDSSSDSLPDAASKDGGPSNPTDDRSTRSDNPEEADEQLPVGYHRMLRSMHDSCGKLDRFDDILGYT
ncbi:hypothetical protein BDV25DRAFT_128676 [Aspergillus avenaceus]|uniref:Rhodopsin domain-containing protein n=1 Tax=Aspergillus avenaceus TaxID=36643 RepID=A0A5N6TZ40_ASPAV|nr:hypothetical protein BDV25DRAFT_128676 [Aspergillus avenaceus]